MKLPRRSAEVSPFALAELAMNSWETICRRTVMMAQGTCSPAEYVRMSTEKLAALEASMRAAMSGQGSQAVLAPYLVRARANVRRLRAKP